MLTVNMMQTVFENLEEKPVQSLTSGEPRKIATRAPVARVMLLTPDRDGVSAARLGRYGCSVETEGELFAALSGMIDDPMGYDLFVMDCDAFGGIPAAERAIATLIAAGARMRVILISAEFDAPAYPLGLRSVVSLPAHVSETGFVMGIDHVMRDRVRLQLM